MSIAISALIRPSRILFLLTTAMSAAVLFASFAIGMKAIGDLSTPARLMISVSCALAGCGGFLLACQSRKAFRIDISGVGQIRLREYIELIDPVVRLDGALDQTNGELVELLPDSTMWSCFMLLRFADDAKRVITIPVFRDSMTEDGFQAVAVACRWIASQPARAENETG